MRSSGAPKGDRARLLARYHVLADRELLNKLTPQESLEMQATMAALDVPFHAAHIELLEQIRRDRQELQRSLDEIRATVQRATS